MTTYDEEDALMVLTGGTGTGVVVVKTIVLLEVNVVLCPSENAVTSTGVTVVLVSTELEKDTLGPLSGAAVAEVLAIGKIIIMRSVRLITHHC